MGVQGIEHLTEDDEPSLKKLAQLVRETLSTEDDYHVWKTTGAWAVIRTCNVIENNPEYHSLSDSDIGTVVRMVGEMIADL